MKKLLLTAMVALAFSGSIFAQINSNLYESHWSDFNSGPYETLDAVIAFFQINGEYISDEWEWESIEIAAYVDGECRGHSFLTEDEDLLRPYTELCIYHNDSSACLNKEISFRLYDHAEEIEYVIPSTSIRTGEDHVEIYLEDFNNAVVLNFEENILKINLVQGWNWISLGIAVDEPTNMLDMLKASLGENATEIQSVDFTTEFDGEDWFGDLDEEGMYNEQMYLINVENGCTIELTGMPAVADEYEITINPGWNWIGFPSVVAIDVVDALSDFDAAEGDEIQDVDFTTEFDGEDWFGDLQTFKPGRGLLYNNTTDEVKTFVFSRGAKKTRHITSNPVRP